MSIQLTRSKPKIWKDFVILGVAVQLADAVSRISRRIRTIESGTRSAANKASPIQLWHMKTWPKIANRKPISAGCRIQA
ncbi:MAG: hypothetical protein ACI8UO_006032 [Verrucomicrobiales bacterium]